MSEHIVDRVVRETIQNTLEYLDLVCEDIDAGADSLLAAEFLEEVQESVLERFDGIYDPDTLAIKMANLVAEVITEKGVNGNDTIYANP